MASALWSTTAAASDAGRTGTVIAFDRVRSPPRHGGECRARSPVSRPTACGASFVSPRLRPARVSILRDRRHARGRRRLQTRTRRMQFYQDGYRPGDPDILPAAPGADARGASLPDEVDVLIDGSG